MNHDPLPYEELQARLDQAEATLAALRSGQVDILIGDTEPLVVRYKSLLEKERLFFDNERLAKEWQTTFDSVHDAVWILDANQQVLRANKATEQIFPHTTPGIIGKHCWEIIHGINRPVPECPMLRARKSLQRETMDLQIGDGWYQVTVDPIVDEANAYAGAVHIISDITQAREAQEIIRKRGEALEALYQTGHQFSQTLDTRTIFETLYLWVNRLMPCDGLYISSFSSEDEMIRCLFAMQEGSRLDHDQFPPIPLEPEGKGMQSEVIRSGRPLLVSDVPARLKNAVTYHQVDVDGRIYERDDKPEDGNVTRSALLVPMILEGRVVGVIQVLSYKINAFTQEHLRMLESLSVQTAAARNNALLYQQAQSEIAERKRTEAELRLNEERLQLALQASGAGIYEHSIPLGPDTYHSERWAEILGYTREELPPYTQLMEWLAGLVHPDDQALLQSAFVNYFDGRSPHYNVENRMQHKAGHWVYVQSHATATARNENGAVTRLVGVMQDISGRKQAEAEREQFTHEIRRQARHLEQILATIPTGVLLLNAQGQIQHANARAEEALSILADIQEGNILTSLGGRPLTELLTSPPTKGLWHEVQIEKRTYEIISRPVENGPVPEQWVLVVNEVTQERGVQEQLHQQERLAAVGQLAAGIAHDFNNIMATIVLYAQMTVQSAGILESDRKRIEVINKQAWHATKLIEQILDFSRRGILERRPLDLLPLLKEQVKLLERTLPEHITIKLTFAPEQFTIHADPTRMQQMLTNLAVNARDAMPGGGRLNIKIERFIIKPGQIPFLPDQAKKEWVKLTVSDSGTGIAPHVLPHIFEPFYTTKGPGQGSGLGLAQAYGIVGQHGGYIGAESQEGAGAVFTIYLPLLEEHSEERTQAGDEEALLGNGEILLVVEDEPTLRNAMVSSLEQLNYQVVEAANGEQALAVLAERGGQIALILSDVVMPVMGGMALLHALRQNGWDLPVILLTGHPLDKELEAMRTQGNVNWMAKPVGMNDLSTAISKALLSTRN